MPQLSHAKPHEIGLDADRLNRAYALLEEWTAGETPVVPGGAILVGSRGRVVEPRFFGRQSPAGSDPIRRDACFLLASISKPITYMGAMLLVERGMLNLSDRVTRYLPEFAAHHKEETLVLHLFTHTSGMPDMLDDNLALRQQHAPLSRYMTGAIRETVPLFPAGTNLSYQSMGTLVVAAIIEKLTNQPLAEFLRKEIFDPLELPSTRLGSRGLDRGRIVQVQTPAYLSGGESYDWNSQYWHELGTPWGGLFSTPEDFAVICQMLLNAGQFDGRRIWSPATVGRAVTNRLNDLPLLPESIRRTQPWGLGWRLNHRGTDDSWGDLLGDRVFGHSGACGTLVWIDPERDGYCILFTSALREAAPWRLVHLSNIVASAFV